MQRMKLFPLSETFDRCDIAAFDERSERQTRFDAPAVHQHGAGAALSQGAALFRSCKTQVLAQCVEQRCARIKRQAVLGSVDAQHNIEWSGRRSVLVECSGRGVAGLCGHRSRDVGQEGCCGESTAGSGGNLQQLSSC